jgi:hypothetical protein
MRTLVLAAALCLCGCSSAKTGFIPSTGTAAYDACTAAGLTPATYAHDQCRLERLITARTRLCTTQVPDACER